MEDVLNHKFHCFFLSVDCSDFRYIQDCHAQQYLSAIEAEMNTSNYHRMVLIVSFLFSRKLNLTTVKSYDCSHSMCALI